MTSNAGATAAVRASALAVVAALALTTTAASAKHHHGHSGDDNDAVGDAPMNSAGAADAGAPMDEEDTADDDGGAPLALHRTPEQADRRDSLVAKEHEFVRGLAIRSGKKLSPRVRQAIGLHWRHVMRLSRIRELAEQEHDTASVTQVDTLLDHADAHFTKQMAKLIAVGADGGSL